jgi:hypothetical protein
MRISEIASAEEQIALFKLITDKVWQALGDQKSAELAKFKPRPNEKKSGLAGGSYQSSATRRSKPKSSFALAPQNNSFVKNPLSSKPKHPSATVQANLNSKQDKLGASTNAANPSQQPLRNVAVAPKIPSNGVKPAVLSGSVSDEKKVSK